MSRSLSLKLVAIVILSCYFVPYALIGQVGAWYGSFLFWCLAGVAIIVLNITATASFDGDAE